MNKGTKISSEVLTNLVRLYLLKHEQLDEHNTAFCYCCNENNGRMGLTISLTYKQGDRAPSLIRIDLKMLKALVIDAVVEVKESNQSYYRSVGLENGK